MGPKSPIWAEDVTLWSDDGLHQGSPSAGPAFAFIVQPWARMANMRLAEVGGCARFEMDYGYLVGSRGVIFKVLGGFTKGIREGT
jgi:hypothetical protein